MIAIYSVTERIRRVKQPYGGYVHAKNFEIIFFDDGKMLNDNESIHASLIGMAVDYLTRYMMGTPVEQAFAISINGAVYLDLYSAKMYKLNGEECNNAKNLMSGIRGLDDLSILNACKLVGYDVCVRAGVEKYKPVASINPSPKTIENIRIMVQRCLSFWEQYGPIVLNGFTFTGGYTPTISSGDGDYLTEDTLWDLKVEKQELGSRTTLQLLVYYLMGIHSVHQEFRTINRLGVFNPRKNKAYLLRISDIPQWVIDAVSNDVIGFGLSGDKYGIPKAKETAKSHKEEQQKTVATRENEIKVGDFTVGMRVKHRLYGIGKVRRIQTIPGLQIISVDFIKEGNKKIVSSALKIIEE